MQISLLTLLVARRIYSRTMLVESEIGGANVLGNTGAGLSKG